MQNTRINIESLLELDRVRRFLEQQRWFGAKARSIASVRVADAFEIGEQAWLTVIGVGFDGGDRQDYLLPLALVDASHADALQRERPEAVLAPLDDGRTFIDGVFDDRLCIALLDLIQRGRQHVSDRGTWTPDRREQHFPDGVERIRRTAPDQSNTSILFGDTAILKVFRRLESGPNPDVEMNAFLTRIGFPHVPRTLGTLEYAPRGEAAGAVAMLQEFVPNRGNGWEVLLQSLASVDAEVSPARRESPPLTEALPSLLGRRTGELHVHLARGDGEAFAPEAFRGETLVGAADDMRRRAEAHLQLLASSLQRLDPRARDLATAVLDARNSLLDVFTTMAALDDAGQRIRCHGDYHLGQTLVTEQDVVILDFEGEPARPLSERRAKSSPLKDVAGMLRSFSYAATTAARSGNAGVSNAAVGAQQAWEAAAARLFLSAYFEATAGNPILPAHRRDADSLLRAYLVEKATYEIAYELNNRPDWVAIPLAGVLQCLDAAPVVPESLG